MIHIESPSAEAKIVVGLIGRMDLMSQTGAADTVVIHRRQVAQLLQPVIHPAIFYIFNANTLCDTVA